MAKINLKKKLQFWGTGRRKKAIARVRLIPAGSGTIVINDRTFEDYFPQGTLQYIVKQPLVLLDVENKYDVFVNVIGGGYTGQAGAIRLGIARALLEAEPDSRPALKKEGFLTRDPPRQGKKEVRPQKGAPRSAVLQEIIFGNFQPFNKTTKPRPYSLRSGLLKANPSFSEILESVNGKEFCFSKGRGTKTFL